MELSSGKPGSTQRIVETFFADVPVKLGALRAGLAGGDGDAVSRTAHTLKGGCPYVGAVRLYELCEEVEAAMAAGDFEGAAEMVDQIDREVPALRSSIDRELKRLGS